MKLENPLTAKNSVKQQNENDRQCLKNKRSSRSCIIERRDIAAEAPTLLQP